MVGAVFETFARDLLDFAELRDGETVLDVACGTGIVARLARPKVGPAGSVVGMDVNPGMLEVAQKVSALQGAKIKWAEGDVADMPISDNEFDVVICQHGLQYFRDRPAALREMHRVLGVPGRLILSVWRPIKFNAGHAVFAGVLERHVNAEAAATRRAPFKLSDRAELSSLVSTAGFRNVTVRLSTRVVRFASAEAMIRMMMAGTPLGATMGDSDPQILTTVIDEVTSGLFEYLDDQGLAIPMQTWVVTAEA